MKEFLKDMTPKKWLSMCLAFVLITGVGLCLLRYDMREAGLLEDAAMIEELNAEPTVEPYVLVGDPVNINTASAMELMAIPGIGEATAQRIIDYREQTPFKVTRDIKKIDGVGDKTFEKICNLICVSDE